MLTKIYVEFSRPRGHEARVIEVLQGCTATKDDAGKFFTNATVPALLHVCQESRIEALKQYQLLTFSYDAARPETLIELSDRRLTYPINRRHIWDIPTCPTMFSFSTFIDYDQDILYFQPIHLTAKTFYENGSCHFSLLPVLLILKALLMHPEASVKIKALGFDLKELTSTGPIAVRQFLSRKVLDRLLTFKNLTTIALVRDTCCCENCPDVFFSRKEHIPKNHRLKGCILCPQPDFIFDTRFPPKDGILSIAMDLLYMTKRAQKIPPGGRVGIEVLEGLPKIRELKLRGSVRKSDFDFQ